MRRRILFAAAAAGLAAAAALLVLGLSGTLSGATSASVIRVPQDAPTLAEAISRAVTGDTILLDRGTYPGGVAVPPGKSGITIKGVDRNRVVLDGGDQRDNAIVVHADRVAILNLSAHNYRDNGFYWDDVSGFRASYLTVWNVGKYGIYAEGSSGGTVDHDYVSGAADAAYYIGECKRCRSTLRQVVARLSAVGYSGTNASGVVIRDSLWDRNGAGIVPNTYANEKDPPQERNLIVRNRVLRSGRARVPIYTPLAGFIGVGIAVAGGNANTIRGNRIETSERYGIAVFSTAYRVDLQTRDERRLGARWRPRSNKVIRNVVRASGLADLALAAGSGGGNCFRANRAAVVLPRGLQRTRCTRRTPVGDKSVAAKLTAPVGRMLADTLRRRRPPPYTAMPKPPQQPNMP